MDVPNNVISNSCEPEPMDTIAEAGLECMESSSSNIPEKMDITSIMNLSINDEELPLITNTENKQVFRFFWWDAHEDSFNHPGVVFLFGKVYVESSNTYNSCCVAVRNIERRLYFLPRAFRFEEDLKTETNIPVKMIDVYNEFNDKISDQLKINMFRAKPVTKKYAFDPEIPQECNYLEIRYSATGNVLNANKKGQTFSKIFGTNTSVLEILLLDRQIKGPCWLDVVNPILAENQSSYCRFEVDCNSLTDLIVPSELENKSPPPLTVLTLYIRTTENPINKISEVSMIGCLAHSSYNIEDKPPIPNFESHFCAFTAPSHENFPVDIFQALQTYKTTKVQKCDSETALLNYFTKQFEKIDPDLIIGHDLIDYYFGLICSRLNYIEFNAWSKLGKLKRRKIPKNMLDKKELMIGRLICDLKLLAKEYIKARSYDLNALFEQLLDFKIGRIVTLDVYKMFLSSSGILQLINLTMSDAENIMRIIFNLNVIPLSLQITKIVGNVLSKTLLGGQSDRSEYLLLHAFTEKNYIVPDKKAYIQKTDSKKPMYSGGLTLEPKIGFYETLIVVLDFNSLYPNIIQEYNICFTTISSNINVNELKINSKEPGVLPIEIKKLVVARKEIKTLMMYPQISPELKQQYNIKQTALKLIANSLYGCLGSTFSRFYTNHIASLITQQGRNILTSTKDLVEGMNLEVIYGDTDSIMINIKNNDYDEALKIGENIKEIVNKSYRQLELEIEAIYKYLLLLKKKKYAALTISKDVNGEFILKQVYKGLDIIRSDFSQISSEIGINVLNFILSDITKEEKIKNIEKCLNTYSKKILSGNIDVSKLVLTKRLGKNPKSYTEKNILPHVYVALRYNINAERSLGAGDTVSYVICDDSTNLPVLRRAYHIEDFQKSKKLKIDFNYYLLHQIYPVIKRLCEPIEGLNEKRLTEVLRLDPKYYKKLYTLTPKNAFGLTRAQYAEIQLYDFHKVDHFTIKCPICHEINTITAPEIDDIPLEKCSNFDCNFVPAYYVGYIENWLHVQIRHLSEKYYNAVLVCQNQDCLNETDRLPIKFDKYDPICPKCDKNVMKANFVEKDVYIQLKYFKYIFDLDKMKEKPPNMDERVIQAYELLKEKANKYMHQSGYSWIDLSSVFETNLTSGMPYVILSDTET